MKNRIIRAEKKLMVRILACGSRKNGGCSWAGATTGTALNDNKYK